MSQIGDKKAWKPIIGAGFIAAYHNVIDGLHGHPVHGGCKQCNDAEVLAALKYHAGKCT